MLADDDYEDFRDDDGPDHYAIELPSGLFVSCADIEDWPAPCPPSPPLDWHQRMANEGVWVRFAGEDDTSRFREISWALWRSIQSSARFGAAT